MSDLNGSAGSSPSTTKPSGSISLRGHIVSLDRAHRLELLALTISGFLCILLAPLALRLLAFNAVRDNVGLGDYISNFGNAFQQWGAVVILLAAGCVCLLYASLQLTDRAIIEGPSRSAIASCSAFAALAFLPLPVVPLLFATVALWFRPSRLVRSLARVVFVLGVPVLLFWITRI